MWKRLSTGCACVRGCLLRYLVFSKSNRFFDARWGRAQTVERGPRGRTSSEATKPLPHTRADVATFICTRRWPRNVNITLNDAAVVSHKSVGTPVGGIAFQVFNTRRDMHTDLVRGAAASATSVAAAPGGGDCDDSLF
jgi:hypothetical protein